MPRWKASGLTDTAVVVREIEKEAEILLSALISAGPESRLMGDCKPALGPVILNHVPSDNCGNISSHN